MWSVKKKKRKAGKDRKGQRSQRRGKASMIRNLKETRQWPIQTC